MKTWTINSFGVENLSLNETAPQEPKGDKIAVDVQALSLNYRDLMVVKGMYNPKLKLPATPISDGAGVVAAVGRDVTRFQPGDRVVSHFIPAWTDGPFSGDYGKSSLGTPGPGLAAEQVVLPERAWVKVPESYSFAQAATLPIAALTAWSSLVTEGRLQEGETVLTLGTGGVSIFALQLAKAMGAKVIITSSKKEKMARAVELGADHAINYAEDPEWEKNVLDVTDGRGADLVVETGGAATLNQSMRACKPGGRLAILGALTGLQSDISTALILMKRLTLCGIYVDSRAHFEKMNEFLESEKIQPVIDKEYDFAALPDALHSMARGEHFGKIVVRVAK
ncbi:MAG: NAD(P)-dependent alcohol dehydrogenase [Phycisphaerae bacterium]